MPQHFPIFLFKYQECNKDAGVSGVFIDLQTTRRVVPEIRLRQILDRKTGQHLRAYF